MDKLLLAIIILLATAWVWLGYVYLNYEPYTVPQAHKDAYATLCPIGSTPIITERGYSMIINGKINLTPTQKQEVLNCCTDNIFGTMNCQIRGTQ